jgi:hypothetical protein
MGFTHRASQGLALSLAAALLLSGCATQEIRLQLAPVELLREDLRELTPKTREAYQFALSNPYVLTKIPCYCGCASIHKNVKECFVREIQADGTIIWDDMGKG